MGFAFVLTDMGKQAFDAALRLQIPWANGLSDGLSVKEIQTAHRVVAVLRGRLEGNGEAEA